MMKESKEEKGEKLLRTFTDRERPMDVMIRNHGRPEKAAAAY